MKLSGAFLYVLSLSWWKSENGQSSFVNVADRRNEIFTLTVNFVEHCSVDKTERLVLAGNWSNYGELLISRIFKLPMSGTVIGSFEDSMFHIHKRVKNAYSMTEAIVRRKKFLATRYVISMRSNSTLFHTLRILRESLTWNYEAFFLIVNENFIGDGCGVAETSLRTVWFFNVLSAVFLCRKSDGKYRIYTFNPYTHYAPSAWRQIKHSGRLGNDTWTLYEYKIKRSFRITHSWCTEILNYDKTISLDGFTVNMGIAVTSDQRRLFDPTKTGFDRYIGRKGEIARMLWNHLNATANIVFYPMMCIYDKTNNFCGIMKDMMTGKLDYIMNPLYQRDFWKQQSYPYSSSGLCAVASMIQISSTAKFLLVFGWNFWLITITTGFGSAIFLKYLLKVTMVSSSLEFLRMILGLSTIRQPQDSSSRILFAVLIFVTMMLNAYFQSRMSAMYIAPDADPAIETIENLERSNLEVIGNQNFKEFFTYSAIFRRYRSGELRNCLEDLNYGEPKACIFPCTSRYLVNESQTTHVARNMMKECFLSFIGREDWPLLSRFNQLLRRMKESGFIMLFDSREARYLEKPMPSKEVYVKLSIKQWSIAVYTCTIGWIAATCIFIIEIGIYLIKNNGLIHVS